MTMLQGVPKEQFKIFRTEFIVYFYFYLCLRNVMYCASPKAENPSMAIYGLPRYGRTGNPGRLHLAMDSNHNALEGSPGQVTLGPLYTFQGLVWPSPSIPILPRSPALYQYETIRAVG
jgi:hypothetical protein